MFTVPSSPSLLLIAFICTPPCLAASELETMFSVVTAAATGGGAGLLVVEVVEVEIFGGVAFVVVVVGVVGVIVVAVVVVVVVVVVCSVKERCYSTQPQKKLAKAKKK